jgi:phosphate butyryltransferase
MILKSMDTFIEIAKQKQKKKIVVAAAEDEQVLIAVSEAKKEGIAEPILVGNIQKIEEIAKNINFNLEDIEIIEEIESAGASKRAVSIIREGHAQILMKGMVSTADFLRAILDKDYGLRNGELLSHIAFFETSAYHKLIAITDAAQNIAPTFEEKISIIKNSIDFYHHLGIDYPKIAILAAVENVNPKMEATIHAALLTRMNQRNQIKGCIIDGPLAFDNAVSKEACEHKGIISDVGGDPDLLVGPDIEASNVLYKSFTYFANALVAAIILGATCPIVLTSRADSERSKFLSITLAACY